MEGIVQGREEQESRTMGFKSGGLHGGGEWAAGLEKKREVRLRRVLDGVLQLPQGAKATFQAGRQFSWTG